MYEQLESDLRQTFSRHAAALPAESEARLCGIDFHPRGARWSGTARVTSLAGAAAATGTVVSVLVLGGAQPAFAGWTAAPTPSSSDQSTAAAQNCQTQIDQSPAVGTSSAAWTPVDTDVRGPYTVTVYKDGASFATCFNGPSFTVVNAESPDDQSSSGSVHVGSGAGAGPSSTSIGIYAGSDPAGVTQLTVSHLNLDQASGGPYTLVEGQIGSDVTGVTLVRSDGQDVQATTGDGWLVGWWPGTAGVSSAAVTSPSGQTSETFSQTTLPGMPGGPQCSSSSGSSPSASATCLGYEPTAP
jgi:hypothetical protein